MFENLTQQPKPQPVQNEEPTIVATTDEMVDIFNLSNINLSFKTANGVFTLFDNFNLRIEDIPNEGQFVSILGASGSGKSQILKLLS
jgi:ABC-type transport system involved in cytochrome bd biosynthesis fused ATPase/permease subunit